MKRKSKTYIAVIAAVLLTGSATVLASDGGESIEDNSNTETPNRADGQAQNVIFLIPDGFSQSYANNYRLFKEEGLPVWEEHDMLSASVMTDSADSVITDSAAAGTAFASGQKTNNGMLGLDPDGNELHTLVDVAKENGKKTGLVATSTITHATPAAFAANVESRQDYETIAEQMVENDNLDLLFGGGRTQFLPAEQGGIREDGVDLIASAEEKGYAFIETRRQLLNWDGNSERLLGLFAEGALEPSIHQRTDEPSLGEMTEVALDFLSQEEEGFFLMVEGSQIDWAGHDNDPLYAMTETAAFEEAVEASVAFAESQGDTLVVVVGDHDTGGMAVHATEEAHPQLLSNVTALGRDIAEEVAHDYSNLADVLEEHTAFEWTEEEMEEMKEADSLYLAINGAMSEKTGFGWSSYDHTAVDVPLYAYGAGSALFNGTIDNTEVPQIMIEAWGLNGF